MTEHQAKAFAGAKAFAIFFTGAMQITGRVEKGLAGNKRIPIDQLFPERRNVT
jgi:uncharacterized membrane protein YqgA involved in biofilm formation